MRNPYVIQSGCWPTMITPFTEAGGIDFDAVRRLVDFFAGSGCAGVFAVCKSSEMFELSLEERFALGRAVVEAAAGRIGVIVSGHISDDPEEQVRELSKMAETGAEALVLVTNRMGPADGTDEAWIERTRALIGQLPDMPLGLYECPYPYPRLMSDAMLRFVSDSGRFFFLKDTCCDEALIIERLALLRGGPLRLFNANTATLLSSIRHGAAGFSGVMANFHAELYSWLCAHPEDERADLLSALLSHLSNMEMCGYPLNAKYHGRFIGVPMVVSTRQSYTKPLTATHKLQTRQMLPIEALACTLVGIEKAGNVP